MWYLPLAQIVLLNEGCCMKGGGVCFCIVEEGCIGDLKMGQGK